MTSRAVVILTEPERCELASPDILMQAVLQIQQLNKAGLAASHAFCDHPAAAMKFVEAYANAYPELQLSAADLPLPEQLYSVIAEGRIMPLNALTTPQSTKPVEASQLYPLYVLSLGAPDALMRVLTHNSFATSDIKVIEIAPVEHPSPDSAAMADAIAHDHRSSGRAESSSDSRNNEDDGFASADWPAGDPLKLDSVEVNLNHIQSDQKRGHEDHYDRALDEPVPTIIAPHPAIAVPTPSTAATGDAGTDPPIPNGGAHHGAGTAAEPPALTAAVSGAALESASPLPSAAGISSGVDAASGIPETNFTAPGADAESATYRWAEVDTSDGPADPAVVDADRGADGEKGKHGEHGGATDGGKLPAGHDLEMGPGPTLAEPSHSGSRPEMASRTEGLSFRDPGGDVAYPPNASFGTDDDVRYPLPAETALGDLLGDLFGRSGHGETVDLEAIFSSLSDPRGASTGPLEDLPFGFGSMRGANSRGADHAGAPNSAPEAPLPSADRHGSDQGDTGHERVPVIHDLDL
jgi:hypothetical protein